MAGKLLELKEAADRLGVTPDQLIEMRSRGEIYGYRDGGTWKFKDDEVERVLAEQGGPAGGKAASELEELMQPLALDDDDSGDELGSILVSEQELGKSGESASSTVIGKSTQASSADSDLQLSGDSGKSSDVNLVKPGSDLKLGGSDISLASQSDLQLAGEGGTGKAGSDVPLGSGKLDFATDSALDLGDDDLVLGGSGVGSDVTLGGGDSGINLASPADSGLSLESEPMELAGGSNVDSFELPEDEEVLSLAGDLSDADEATQLKADEEFLLSPAGDIGGDDSDSGSQVIALEDSEAFDENADTMLRPGQPALVVEDVAAAPLGAAAIAAAPTPAVQAQYLSPQAPEAPYSLMNVLALMCCVMLLAVTGMLMTDLMRNMWAFDSDRVMSTALMDSILSAMGMSN